MRRRRCARSAHFVTQREGGRGAVRELCEMILAAQGMNDLRGHACARRLATDDARASIALVAWSPVLLLGGLAALTYWLDAQVQSSGRRDDGSSRHDPDLYIERFSAVTFDVDGRVRQMLAANARRALSGRRQRRPHRDRRSS